MFSPSPNNDNYIVSLQEENSDSVLDPESLGESKDRIRKTKKKKKKVEGVCSK